MASRLGVDQAMITRDEILKGQECPPELEANLQTLLERLNKLRLVYGKAMLVTSGYRTPEHNARIGGRPKSAHLLCQAADFYDPDKALSKWCLDHEDVLEECQLWMEEPDSVARVHLQSRPASKRVFKP
jgi:hypothetical protein